MQDIAVGIIVSAAVAWTLWNLYAQLSGKKKCNCANGQGHCGGAPKCPNCKS